jgi:hypothetical protein
MGDLLLRSDKISSLAYLYRRATARHRIYGDVIVTQASIHNPNEQRESSTLSARDNVLNGWQAMVRLSMVQTDRHLAAAELAEAREEIAHTSSLKLGQ